MRRAKKSASIASSGLAVNSRNAMRECQLKNPAPYLMQIAVDDIDDRAAG